MSLNSMLNRLHGNTSGVFNDPVPRTRARDMSNREETLLNALDSALGGAMPDIPTNPIDQAIFDLRNSYQQKSDALAQIESDYAALDAKYAEACDSSRYWKGQSDFYSSELERANEALRIANAKIIELATKGRLMTEIGRAFTEIADRAVSEFAPKNRAVEEEKLPAFLNDEPISTRLPENKL